MPPNSVITLAKPTPSQLDWQDLEMGMFLHYGPATWQGVEYDNLTAPLSAINPEKLDVEQWLDVAEAMGAKYIIFVAKHTGGFCMWPTETTKYSIGNTPWRGGKGDICGDLAIACRKRSMGLGFYVSPRDDHFGVTTGGLVRSGNPKHQTLYDCVYVQQLTEILSRYGEQMEVWFDGSAKSEIVLPLIEKYQPNAMIFQTTGATIRWIGNERGCAPYPTWNSVNDTHYEWTPQMDTSESGPVLKAGIGVKWLPAECDVPIRNHYWFWSPENESSLRTLDQLKDIYYQSVGYGCNLLLNHTPDTRGLIPEPDARRSTELGRWVRKQFEHALAETRGEGDVVELNLPAASSIGHVVTMEDVRHGERVLKYHIEAMVDGQWYGVAKGTSIGHKKIDVIEPVTSTKVRFVCTKSAEKPILRSLAVYG